MKWCIPDIGEEEIAEVTAAMKERWVSGFGPRVTEFEKAVARRLDVKYAIAVCNGTCGLIASFMAINRILGKDIIITVPTWTFIASATAADNVGVLMLSDVNPFTFNMEIEPLFSTHNMSDVICSVDAGGVPVNYDMLKRLNKPIVADSCEAFGATYHGKPLGSIVDATVFSFHATKIITTGEGGIVTTNSVSIAKQIRGIVNMGYRNMKKYTHSTIGYNFRMNELSAAIGLVQLKKLDKYLAHRDSIVRIYKEVLEDYVGFQHIEKNTMPSYFIATIVVRPKIRTGIIEELYKKDIPTRVWVPVHKQPPFSHYNNGQFKHADCLAESTIHLPTHNLMSETEALNIASTIKKYIEGTNR